MRRLLGILVAGVLLFAQPAWSQAGRFQVGQRIVQPTTGATGTVTAIDSDKHQVQIHFDSHPANEPGAWFFWGTPDLQRSSRPAQAGGADPGTAPDRRGQGGGNVTGAHGDSPQPAARPYERMPPIGGPLSETVVKKVIEDNLNRPVDHGIERVTFGWSTVSIAAASRMSTLRADIEGIPADAEVYPVRADFNYTVTSIKYPANTTTTDRVGYAYFYLDELRHWTFSWYAHAGTVNSVRHH